ncbi:MAG: hypothetical protein EU531_08970 [Promethearchaeota archaeon]|nr:MAG: hypothetical protein EU531_08970 [Candidatus Lokiarchaeota archaeon]
MSKRVISQIIIDRFGLDLLKKAQDYPINKLTIISLTENPIKIRSTILDDEREFHLIIDEKKKEIFHDCPSFLIHSNKQDKICIHILRLLLSVEQQLSLRIMNNLDQFNFTSEDFGSKKKSKNYKILAQSCFDVQNSVEGLNYLNKAILNQYECADMVEQYLRTALENNLFIEFFEFIKSAHENEIDEEILRFNDYIEKGFLLFLPAISKYSFYNLLRIISFIDKTLETYKIKNKSFLSKILYNLNKMKKSSDFNEKYFAFYFIIKEIDKINDFKNILDSDNLEAFKTELIKRFHNEIDNFCIIDKLKLMKEQFETFKVKRENYYNKYKAYKAEIQELERKVYLKKFSYLKILAEKHKVSTSKIDFRKRRNTYVVNHNKDDLLNPAYLYIIKHIGFFGLNNSTIKSSEIGVNFLIFKELFNDDLHKFPDIFYYKKQFWGENDKYEINPIDGISLLRKSAEYNYQIQQDLSDVKNIMIIEWDLAIKPYQGSIVNAYGSQIIIPDQNNRLFHDLKPFDLCFCQKTPIKIEANIIKMVNIIKKCSFNEAIKAVSSGIDYLEGYYPLSLVNQVLEKKINPFNAYNLVLNNPNKTFIPGYRKFVKAFQKFLFDFIKTEKEYVFNVLKSNPTDYTPQILTLLNLSADLTGLQLPYARFMEDLIKDDITLKQLKHDFLNKIHQYIENDLQNPKKESTIVYDLKSMRNTPFIKYSKRIVEIRKREFENTLIFKHSEHDEEWFDLSEVNKTYYGKKLLKILNVKNPNRADKAELQKFENLAKKIGLNLNMTHWKS